MSYQPDTLVVHAGQAPDPTWVELPGATIAPAAGALVHALHRTLLSSGTETEIVPPMDHRVSRSAYVSH